MLHASCSFDPRCQTSNIAHCALVSQLSFVYYFAKAHIASSIKKRKKEFSTRMSIDMEFNDKTLSVPCSYISPITLSLMVHPLLSKTGMHYERSAIFAWLKKSNTCPMTRQPLYLSHLISDRALENEIKLFKERNGIMEPADDEETADRCSHVEKLALCAIASYSPRKQKQVLERYQTERIRRMVRRAVA